MTLSETPQPTIPGTLGVRRSILIAALGVLLAFPAMRGGFVGGDDHRLVLNHVLVNQPSFAHAVELFKIVHRDLYQPLPLLSFQCEFLVGKALGFFDTGPDGGAWLFHLNNLLLHGLCAVLAGWLVLTVSRLRYRGGEVTETLARTALLAATIAGVLFATHPFQTEVASWINGRMMLLSTAFALAASLAFLRYLETARKRMLVAVLVFVVLSCLSKVRAPLPMLLGIVTLASTFSLNRRFYVAWIPACVLVGLFVAINLQATADASLFEGGAENLHGSRVVRILLALGFYFQHLVYPVGLCSYYPTPIVARWADPATVHAIAVVAATAIVLGAIAWKCPSCRYAIAWCAFAIGDTLPFFPARNVLAADRYMYLPMLGVAWCIGELVARYIADTAHGRRGRLVPALGCVLVFAFIATGWDIADAYTTPLKKTLRTATLFPDTPRVWQKVGWCYEHAGDHERAIEAAKRELKHDDALVQSQALQLLGTALIHQGKVDEGLATLHEAIARSAKSSEAKKKLGAAYDELGQFEKAIEYYEQRVDDAPGDNPTIRRLAMLYRRFGRLDEARQGYEQVLASNPFDPEAVIGLTELDIERATDEAYKNADARLGKLLKHLPTNGRLISNRAMVRFLASTADEHMRTASRAFVALTDGRYATAAKRIDAISGSDPSMREARAWLREAIGSLSAERPDEPWVYAFITRILIADGEVELAIVSLDLFQQRCSTDECGRYAGGLRAMMTRGE
jgi:protein O-mannosyl-transferase